MSSAWLVIGNLFAELFSRKLLASLAGIAGIVAMIIVLGESLGPEVIDRDVIIIALGSIVSIVLYQVTKISAVEEAKAKNDDEEAT